MSKAKKEESNLPSLALIFLELVLLIAVLALSITLSEERNKKDLTFYIVPKDSGITREDITNYLKDKHSDYACDYVNGIPIWCIGGNKENIIWLEKRVSINQDNNTDNASKNKTKDKSSLDGNFHFYTSDLNYMDKSLLIKWDSNLLTTDENSIKLIVSKDYLCKSGYELEPTDCDCTKSTIQCAAFCFKCKLKKQGGQ